MPVTEKSGLLKYKDKTGNLYIMLPITNTDNVDGLDEMIDEAKIVGTAVAATSTDGVAYTATVPGITALTAGDSFVMIPDKISTSRSTTLNINNLGAKNLRVRVSGYSGTTSSPMTANWLASNKPVRVTYDGMWWIAEVVLPSAQQLYGNVPAEDVTYSNTNSGMTAADVQEAIDELAGGKTSTQVLTTAEYNALTDKNENVLYMLSDDTSEADMEAHLVDTTKHITTDEREKWNKNTLAVDMKITLPVSTDWTSVCYGNGKFVVMTTRDSVTAYSTDGINWVQTTLPASSSRVWYSVCYGDGKLVAVSSNSNTAAYSTDGINWTKTTMPASKYWYSVCYGDGKFVAVATSSSDAAYSTDGINWTQTTLPFGDAWHSVCYGDGKFVAVVRNSKYAAYSTNGIDWTQATLPASANWHSVCYGDGKFVAVTNDDSAVAAYSTNGINWVQATLPANEQWRSICYGDDKFVAVANGFFAAYSTDGINWTKTTMPVSAGWYSVCYGDGKFVAVTTGSNAAAYSTDGINWTSKGLVLTSTKEYIDTAIATKAPAYTYGTSDLTAGTSSLGTGKLYFVYE